MAKLLTFQSYTSFFLPIASESEKVKDGFGL